MRNIDEISLENVYRLFETGDNEYRRKKVVK